MGNAAGKDGAGSGAAAGQNGSPLAPGTAVAGAGAGDAQLAVVSPQEVQREAKQRKRQLAAAVEPPRDRFCPRPDGREDRELRHRVTKARNAEMASHFARYERSRLQRVGPGDQGQRHAYATDEWADPVQALMAGPQEGEFEAVAGKDSIVRLAGVGLAHLPPRDIQQWAPVCLEAELARNRLTSLPASFGSLAFLTKLDLSDNNLQELPESVGRLRSLTHLDLSGNALRELPDSFGALERLTRIWLSRNALVRLPELFDATSIELFAAEGNRISEVPPSIDRFSHLRTLLLSDNRIKELPFEVGRLKSLRRLSLANNDLVELPPSFPMLDLLAYLRLEGNRRLILRGVACAGGLGALESLTLSDTGVDAVPAEAPRKLLTYAQRRCRLVTVLPAVFQRWERIRDLDLSENRIQSIPAEIGRMSSLRTLHVGDNRLQELPHELCQCKALTELRAPRNALQSLPPAFGRLERLTTLDLSENKELRSLPASFAKLVNLRVLCLWQVGLHMRGGRGVPGPVQDAVLLGPELCAVRMDRGLLAKLPARVVERLTKEITFSDA